MRLKIPFTEKIERVPEELGLYDKLEEVNDYVLASQRGIVAFIEKLFTKSVLKNWGHKSHMRILDVGTGPGWIPIMLAKARPTWDITVLDVSHLMLQKAQRYAEKSGVHLKYVQVRAEKTSLPSNHFDLIISHFAFSEIPKGSGALREMERLLKPEGHIFIQDILRPSQWQFPILVAWRYLTQPFNRMSRQYVESLRGAYTVQEVNHLFRASGFTATVKVFMRWGGGIVRIEGAKDANARFVIPNE